MLSRLSQDLLCTFLALSWLPSERPLGLLPSWVRAGALPAPAKPARRLRVLHVALGDRRLALAGLPVHCLLALKGPSMATSDVLILAKLDVLSAVVLTFARLPSSILLRKLYVLSSVLTRQGFSLNRVRVAALPCGTG